ncbi:hypothetical protein Lalb_Chr00c21g0406151 (mitochondrion) [Lupinus albus]|uniref:Uncharacterized protein n=1 Tax=Lupinus albus TaxID=3870 RepID=A0A6A4MJ47_LUPAL|nr:hypothetical protein Lalb_Chr00c21g0406151 [Lupinus albus]
MWDRAPLGSSSRECSLRLTGGLCHPVQKKGDCGVFSTIEISAAGMIQPLVHCHLSPLIPLEQSQLSQPLV